MENNVYKVLLDLRMGAPWPLSARQQRLADQLLTSGAHSDTLNKGMFELLLKWRMRCEPWPLGEGQRHVLDAYLRREARRHGFDGWIHAHHDLHQPVVRSPAAPISAKPSSKARRIVPARSKATAEAEAPAK